MSEHVEPKKNQIPILSDAWEIVDGQPHLVGTKCGRCGRAFFPPRAICTYCLTDEEVGRAVLGRTGQLYAATTIRIASKEFNPPYPFGYVLLEPEGIRIPTQIASVEVADDLPAGTQMEMVIEPFRVDSRGNEWITFKFRPVL